MNETIKHLELIQGVINRMAQVSFILKGWMVTLVVGLLAVTANTANWWYSLLGCLVVCVFWGLDAYYLRQERLFRCLYDRIRLGPTEPNMPIFSMDTSVATSEVSSWWRILFSRTLQGLYVPFIIITIIAVILVLVTANPSNP